MTETKVIERIETELKDHINSFTVDVVGRDFTKRTEYTADFVVLFKDKLLTQDILKSLIDSLVDDGIDEIEVVGTQKKLDDLDFEVLTIRADINLI